MPLGQRKEVTFEGFAGVDIERNGIYIATYDAPDMYRPALLPDAFGCRFSQGRAYWYRHQIYFHCPLNGCAPTTRSFTPSYIERTGDGYCHVYYVTSPLSGVKRVLVLGSGTWNEDGVHELTEPYGPSQVDFYWSTSNPDREAEYVETLAVHPECVFLFGYFSPRGQEQLILISSLGSFWASRDFDWRDLERDMWGYRVVAYDDWRPVRLADLNHGPDGAASLSLDHAIWGAAPLVGAGDYAFLVGAPSTKWPTGLPTMFWDGENLRQAALYPPQIGWLSLSATVLSPQANDALPAGGYAYRIAYYDGVVESPAAPDVESAAYVAAVESTATGYACAAGSSTLPQHLDTLTVGSIVYRFVDTASNPSFDLQPYDIVIQSGIYGCERTYSALAEAIRNGLTTVRYDGVPVYTPPHPDVTGEYTTVSGNPGVSLEAREAGEAGNSIALDTNAPSRITLSGSALAGGRSNFRIRLSGLPTSHPRATHIRIYRAYTAQVENAPRPTVFYLLDTVAIGSSTYDDNTPPQYLSQLLDEEQGGPPRGTCSAWWCNRLWIGGITHGPEGSRRYGSFTSADISGGYVTVNAGAGHGVKVGDVVSVWVAGNTDMQPYAEAYVTSVTATTFTFKHPGLWTNADVRTVDMPSDGTAGAGYYAVIPAEPSNALRYSTLDDPFKWPVENVIYVGDDKPIIGLQPAEDRLIILKPSEIWELRGQGENEWQLIRVQGTRGAKWGLATGSPYGVLWCGHGGWELYDGNAVRMLLRFVGTGTRTSEAPEVSPPCEPFVSWHPRNAWHVCCWHAGRFYMLSTRGRVIEFEPETGVWTIRSLEAECVGLQRLCTPHGDTIVSVCHTVDAVSHITFLDWAWDKLYEAEYAYMRGPYPNYNEVARGVRVELPPLVAPPGCVIQPLEVIVQASWIRPTYWSQYVGMNDSRDLHLRLAADAGTWTDLGVVPTDGRLTFNGSYAGQTIRLCLQGSYVEKFVLHRVRVIYAVRSASALYPPVGGEENA